MLEVASAADSVDYATARKSLPIAYLLEKYDYEVTETTQGIRSNCPFHQADGQEHNQTFNAFGEGIQKFGCWSCDAKGDALDLLKLFEPELIGPEGKDSIALFRRAHELIVECIDSGWTGPRGGSAPKTFDVHEAQEVVHLSQQDINYDLVGSFIAAKQEQRGARAWPYSSTWLIEEFGVGTFGKNWLIIPYWDKDNELIAYKRWTAPENPRVSATGASWAGHLYGDWREDDGERPILLCEGESDTWYAHWHVGKDYRVLGLPTGVQSNVSPAKEMKDRTVLLAFDGDEPGRGAARRWSDALEAAGANVKIVPVPEDQDISKAGDLRILLSQARPPVKAPTGLMANPSGYVRIDAKGGVSQVSNWVFVPKRGLHGDGTFAFEGILKPGGDKAIIASRDLSSDAKAKAWAAQHGRAWFGNSKDASLLLGCLQAEEVFLPAGRLVSVAGLHGGTFVWPGGRIGPEPLAYVPPGADAHLEDTLKIEPGPFDPAMVHTLRDIQAHDVTDPLLAWMAMAAVRSLLAPEGFPFVAVSGSHGSGKTETTKAIVSAFTGSAAQATFRSSPHALTSAIAATNAFVTVLGEYRKGGRTDTRAAGDQLLRENYTMMRSQKGGGGDNWNELSSIIPAAPIILEGEDMLTEGSHFDRMIQIKMDVRTQNSEAFSTVRSWGPTGIPWAWLSFLQTKIANKELVSPLPISPFGPKHLNSRQRHNLGVLRFGWSLLQEFMSEYNDQLGAPRFEKIMSELEEFNKHTPIEEAIRWCLGEGDTGYFIKIKPDDAGVKHVWMQVDGFVMHLSAPQRASLFVLPGNASAIRLHVESRMGGHLEREGLREFWVFPLEKLME